MAKQESSGWLDKYQGGGYLDPLGLAVAKKDATTYVPPPKQLTKKQLEESRAKGKQISENTKKAEAQRTAKEVQDRRNRIAIANAAKDKQYDSAENFATATSATADKLRLSENPNLFDDYINPLPYIGEMASGLGQIPLNIKQGDYGQAAINFANPIVSGAGEAIIDPIIGNVTKPITKHVSGAVDEAFPSFKDITIGAKKLSKKIDARLGEYNAALHTRVINPFLDKVVDPIVYRKEMAAVKQAHANAPAYFNDPRTKEKLLNLGIEDPEKWLEYPELTFTRNNGSSYDSKSNILNINFPQLKSLRKEGYDFYGVPVYDHEMGHWLQRESYTKGIDNRYTKDLTNYLTEKASREKELREWVIKSGLDPNKDILDQPLTAEQFKQYSNIRYSKPPLREPFPYSSSTAADYELLNLDKKDYNSMSERQIHDANYFGENFDTNQKWHLSREPYPFSRETKRDMISQGYLKDEFSEVTPEIVQTYFANRGRNRIVGFTEPTTKNFSDLSSVLNRFPSAAPVIGAGAAAATGLLGGATESQKQRNGGQVDQLQPGGKVQMADTTTAPKETKKSKKQTSQLQTYYGPLQFENCQGAGCSKIATTEIANTFGLNYGDLHPQDAWYRRASVLKNKGKEVWNPSMGNDYSGFRVGDLVSLDRAGDTYAKTPSVTPGYTLADNEGNEHVGEIVGSTKEGIPLIKHGSEHGKIYVQPITDLVLPDANEVGVPLYYKPKSVYRLAELENAKIKDNKFYVEPKPVAPLVWKNPNRKPTANEKKYIAAINANASKQQQLFGLSPDETAMINNLGFGIFHNESKAGNPSWKRPVGGKMLGAELLHAFGRDASASLSDVQFKYDDSMYNADRSLTGVGRRMQDIGVKREGLGDWTHHRDDYNDEVNAVSALMSDYLNKFKNNPKYKYDAKNKTIYGDIPIDKALINIYHFGPTATKEKFLRNAKSYAEDALRHVRELTYTGEVPKGIAIHKNSEWFSKLAGTPIKEDGGTINYNNYSVSAPQGYLGDGTFNEGRNYSPAWGGQFQDGGNLSFFDPKLRNMLEGYKPGFMDTVGDYRLPKGYAPPFKDQSSEISTSVGGEGGEPAYLIPTFKYGKRLNDPTGEFNMTGQHLGGPFKTWQDAEKFQELRHHYVEKGQTLPSPIARSNMQMGGSLPGAVGFVYARTNDPAPSNGPYAKKTKASAQDGTQIKTNIPVPIDEIKKANASAEAFNKQYVQSPNYIKLLTNQGYTPEEIKARQDDVLGMTNNDITYANFGPNYVHGDELGKSKIQYNQLGLGDWPSFDDVAAHEWGHVGVYDSGEGSLKPSEQQLLYSKLNWSGISNKPGDFEHDIAPQENRADLMQLRKALQDRGIYDSFKGGEFKQEHLDQLRNYKGDKNEYWNRSMRIYKDQDIIDLMNTIAANNPQQGMPVAQNGTNMSYYQNGLDFKPKSISKNGKKIIKDDMGQWAHPGEITEIGSNQITMQGVPYPVLGISDTGDTQMMYPNEDYTFDGNSVTEYPMMKEGGALQLTKLDQLTNFTNYNTKQPGGWLDKYQD